MLGLGLGLGGQGLGLGIDNKVHDIKGSFEAYFVNGPLRTYSSLKYCIYDFRV